MIKEFINKIKQDPQKYLSFSVIALGLILTVGVVISNQRQDIRQRAAGETTTFSPQIIPLSDNEIGNPMRGAEYYGDGQPPSGYPLVQYSHRWCWREIESTQGQYNFNLIDILAETAKNNGGSFGWRIMPVNLPSDPGCLPSYLSNRIGSGTSANFDDPFYLERVQAMMNAFSQRYANDPRIDVLDMSYVGCWGEWNTACGGQLPSVSVRKAIIDAQHNAFPNKRFVMLTDSQDSLNYALNVQRSKPTGVRVDCLGQGELGGARDFFNNNQLMRDRWKNGGVMYFEYCGGPNFQMALEDIKKYHASLIGDGDGNVRDFTSYSSSDQNLMIQNYKSSGYRFELNSLTLPQVIQPGTQFVVSTSWKNVNTAPAYIPWNVMIQLRNNAGQIVWEGKSQLDLQVPFANEPVGGETKQVNDSFTLPNNVPSGTYTVRIFIADPGNYYPPLKLAIQGRQTDGSYLLGNINVGTAGSVTSNPTATPTPTAIYIPTPTTPPASGNEGTIMWKADWETGNTSQWNGVHAGGSWGDSTIETVTSPVRQGQYAGKFTVRGTNGGDSERAEVSVNQANTGGYAGQDWYYSWSTYIPSNPNKTSGWTAWTDITQWMDLRAHCSPPLEIDITPNNTIVLHNEITTQQENNCQYGVIPANDYPLGPLVYDQWIDFTLHIKWSTDKNIGYVEAWRDGQLMLPKTFMATMDPGAGGVYMEQAFYRAHNTNPGVLYHDNTRRHTAYTPGSIILTPTNTPMATPTIRPTNTSVISPTPTKTPIPTPTPTRVPTPTGVGFTSKVNIFLHGIGKGGDNANPASTGNMNPKHTERSVKVALYSGANQLKGTGTGIITYNAGTGGYSGMVQFGTIPAGTYIAKVIVPFYLVKQIPGFFSLPAATITFPRVYLITGDSNNDNRLTILDYNNLISCFGSKATTASCVNKDSVDLDDNGVIDGIDYNIFLRELSALPGN